ncbi:transcriptional regulator [Acetomicrobium mobile DSM 13181]|uniref:Transcriptional regulator n=1 Tax=Acetomicrobium mobile (strain ATCC BAA-54 / DSM 13181 / JCM 12221 / NGA) TaxID=891968 RepID=I4BZA7_ACEMN|nr:FadR/GntR family transcriptional regulator [Acetomicrobium mobile]AFM22614.1 transcriptional regulator [Acetomicrobium mobile DSM 13181]
MKMLQDKSFLKTSLASKSIVDKVVDQITAAIINGELKPGDKLPTEMEMCESFQVGRNSIREAIKILSAFGVVHIKHAEGTFVSDRFHSRMLDPVLYGLILQKDSATEIMELRQVFDTGILYVAIEKVTPKSIERIKGALVDLEGEILREVASPEKALDADIAFHNTIVQSTNNKLISYIAGYIDRITIPSRIRTMQKIMSSGKHVDFINLHKRITEVIEKRQIDLIEPTVKDHYQFWKLELSSSAQGECGKD